MDANRGQIVFALNVKWKFLQCPHTALHDLGILSIWQGHQSEDGQWQKGSGGKSLLTTLLSLIGKEKAKYVASVCVNVHCTAWNNLKDLN